MVEDNLARSAPLERAGPAMNRRLQTEHDIVKLLRATLRTQVWNGEGYLDRFSLDGDTQIGLLYIVVGTKGLPEVTPNTL
jgi:hypothetical protein